MLQRIIKFRAWDESQNYMAYQGTPDLETIQSFMFHFGDRPLMLFTGLADKSGKDIYEGDIVLHKFRRAWKTDLHKSEVVWNQEYCCYYLNDGTTNHRMRDDMVYEVVGNVYEGKNS